MLKVTVETLPSIDNDRRRTLGTMLLASMADPSPIRDFELSALEAENQVTASPARTCQARLIGHNNEQSVWAIVAAAASAVIGDDVDWVSW